MLQWQCSFEGFWDEKRVRNYYVGRSPSAVYTTIKSDIKSDIKKILFKIFGYIIETVYFKNLFFALKINLENKQKMYDFF